MAAFAMQALALDPTQPFSSYIRTHFSSDEGFDASAVHDITQSADGFLWLSSGPYSLVRFDGRHFTTIASPHGLVLATAPDGYIWVGGDDGLEQIAPADFNQFGRLPTLVYHPGPGASNHITCLHFSRNGAFWVGTADGL